MNPDIKYRIAEIHDWLHKEGSARYRPYPKSRHPVAFKARMMALGCKTEEEVQVKKRKQKAELDRLEQDLKRLEAQEKKAKEDAAREEKKRTPARGADSH